MITLIWSQTINGSIGENNSLLYRSKADMTHFVNRTVGKTVVMGRLTYESIGAPLKARHNIILSSTIEESDEYEVARDITPVLERAKTEEVVILGGGKVYEAFLPYATRLIRTIFHYEADGDTYFPSFDVSDFTETESYKICEDGVVMTFTTLYRLNDNDKEGQ